MNTDTDTLATREERVLVYCWLAIGAATAIIVAVLAPPSWTAPGALTVIGLLIVRLLTLAIRRLWVGPVTETDEKFSKLSGGLLAASASYFGLSLVGLLLLIVLIAGIVLDRWITRIAPAFVLVTILTICLKLIMASVVDAKRIIDRFSSLGDI